MKKYVVILIFLTIAVIFIVFFSYERKQISNENSFNQSSNYIKVLVDDNFMPLSYYDKMGNNYKGAVVDLFENIMADSAIKYEYIYAPELTWSQKLEMVYNGEADIIFPTSITENRIDKGYFSHIYYESYYSLITLYNNVSYITDMNQLDGSTIGTVRATAITEYLIQSMNHTNLILYDDDNEMYSGLRHKEVDFIVQNDSVFDEDFYSKELLEFSKIYKIKDSPKKYAFLTSKSQSSKNIINTINKNMVDLDFDMYLFKHQVSESILIDKYINQKTRQLILMFIVVTMMFAIVIIIYLKKNAKEVLEREIMLNKLAYLQTQIKPHFIYNSLSTIISICYEDGEKAAELLNSFSSYLSILFQTDNVSEFISIREELELVNSYLNIQKARFGDRLHVEFHLDDGVEVYRIKPLMIQPLVENALIHGLLSKEKGGMIFISVKLLKENITVRVEDDGVGMTDKEIDSILKGKFKKSNVGLYNIKSRLTNGTTHFQLESKVNSGTKVCFQIPKVTL